MVGREVILAGRAISQNPGDKEEYVFADGTGQIKLERDEEDLPLNVNIRILGRVESSEIKVSAWERI